MLNDYLLPSSDYVILSNAVRAKFTLCQVVPGRLLVERARRARPATGFRVRRNIVDTCLPKNRIDLCYSSSGRH